MPAYTSAQSSAIFYEEYTRDTYPHASSPPAFDPGYDGATPRKYVGIDENLHLDEKIVDIAARLVPFLGQLLAPGGQVGSAAVGLVQGVADAQAAETTRGKAGAYANIVTNLFLISRGVGSDLPLTEDDLQGLADAGASPSTLRELEQLKREYGPNFITPNLARDILRDLDDASNEETEDLRTFGIRVDFLPSGRYQRYYYSENSLGSPIEFRIMLARARAGSGLVSFINAYAEKKYDARETYDYFTSNKLRRARAYASNYRGSLVEGYILNFGDPRTGFNPNYMSPLERAIFDRFVERDESGRPVSIGGPARGTVPPVDRRQHTRPSTNRRQHSTRETRREIGRELFATNPGAAVYVDEQQLNDLSQLQIQAASLATPIKVAIPVRAARVPRVGYLSRRGGQISEEGAENILKGLRAEREAAVQAGRVGQGINTPTVTDVLTGGLSVLTRTQFSRVTVAPRGTGTLIGTYNGVVDENGNFVVTDYSPVRSPASSRGTRTTYRRASSRRRTRRITGRSR
ncbi:MAG: hypothetical protein OXM61_16740 [Candidatus Poribacteria bacterium]|nr:hypothetical protein [Candidatus Poribacteria bacterium]